MTENDLRPEQAAAIFRALYPGGNYLVRLKNRMARVGFKIDDPLYKLVCEADDVYNRLYLHVHRLSCPAGVYRPSRKP